MLNSKTNWSSNDKYNFTDINRVEGNVEFVANYLNALEYSIIVEVIKNRTVQDFDYTSSFNRLEINIEKLKNKFADVLPNYENRRHWDKDNNDFSFIDANRWEINLEVLYKYIKLMEKSFKYCGTFSCGEDVIE